ncbi:MAG TPA: hypothetical protein VK666_26960 [Chryseolinea sp.]|nr:hypothetical protein [Chryseolinea sp.]
MSKLIEKTDEFLLFEGGIKLYSEHESDCCEHHWLSFDDLTLEDFKGLDFDFTNDNFFKKIEDYGIELFPVVGHSVKIPGYGSNNGYYSSNLTLLVEDENGTRKEYDISECQEISD